MLPSLAWGRARRRGALLGKRSAKTWRRTKAALQAVLRYAAEQGFTSSPLESSEVFLPTTLTDAESELDTDREASDPQSRRQRGR